MFSVMQWKEFQRIVNELNEFSLSQDVLKVILAFIRNNLNLFSVKPFSDYKLADVASIDEEDFPVEYSSLAGKDINHFKSVVNRYSAKDADSIARFLRDSLEELLLIEIDRQCSNCQTWGMLVLKSKVSGELCYMCKVCGRIEFSNRLEVYGDTAFPVKKELKLAGMI